VTQGAILAGRRVPRRPSRTLPKAFAFTGALPQEAPVILLYLLPRASDLVIL
jgi:hypothetical protein